MIINTDKYYFLIYKSKPDGMIKLFKRLVWNYLTTARKNRDDYAKSFEGVKIIELDIANPEKSRFIE